MGMDPAASLQKQRFVGFAFAAGELLLEVEGDGVITFAEGASRHLFNYDPSDLVGKRWQDLFATRDVLRLIQETAALRPGRRSGGIQLQLLGGKTVLLNMYRLPKESAGIHCGLSAASPYERLGEGPSDLETGLMTSETFSQAAGALVADPNGQARNARLTVLNVAGLTKWPGRPQSDTSKAVTTKGLLHQVGATLQALSMNGLAARMTPDRFGVIHDTKIETGAVNEALAQTLREASDGAFAGAPEASSMPLSQPGLRTKEAMQAVKFALSRLSDPNQPPILPNRLDIAVDAMVQATVDRMAAFQQFIRSGELQLAYQPIVDLKSRAVHHFEALARIDPAQSPAESISFAESTGLAPELDLAVWSLAVETLGSAPGHVRMAINLSGRSLDDTATSRALLSLLESNANLTSRIFLEVTESAELRDLAEADRTIQAFRKLGVKVCIDDFGAGAASFQYLQALSVDFLKLDGSYIKQIGTSRKNMILVRALANICRDLGITSIAEHVETESDAIILKDIGIDLAQGYLFGRPLSKLT